MPYSSSGWFDDPDDDSQLRYFDGVVWTQHTAAKRPPVPPPGPASADWARPDAGHAHGYGSLGAPVDVSTGAYASWWRRALALLLDSVLLGLLATPFVGGRAAHVNDTMSALIDDMVASGTTTPVIPDELVSDLLVVSLVQLALFLVYEIGMLSWRGATLGRMALGIRVAAKGGGRASFASLVRRTLVKGIGQVALMLPAGLGFGAALFQVVDYLWPLWDADKQALHDKAGATVVVTGRGAGASGTARRGAHRGGRRS